MFILSIVYINIIEAPIENMCSLRGKIKYLPKTIKSATMGARKYWDILDVVGYNISLENNLIASLKGWTIPIIITLLGPFRNWEYPKIFRSNRVINATFTKIGIANNK